MEQLLKDIEVNFGDTQEASEEFSSQVNAAAKLWPAEIKRQVNLLGSPFPGTAEKEILLWKDLDKKIADTQAQLESAPVLLTKLVLKRTNRVAEQLVRESEVELNKAREHVQMSVAFLRDFPIEELLSATGLHPQFSRAIGFSLQHFSKLRHSDYDLSRAARLLEILGATTHDKVIIFS